MKEPLQYTTLDLFLYDLADSIDWQDSEIEASRLNFWQKVYGKDIDNARLNQLASMENSSSNYIELLSDGNTCRLLFESPLNGYYYPVRLGDTYVLQIDYSGKFSSIDPDWESLSTLERLPKIKEVILEKTNNIPATLGKNWLLWGQLTSDSLDVETIAIDCSRVTFSAEKLDFKRTGRYQNASVFEFKTYDNTPDDLSHSQYCLIILFDPTQTKEEIKRAINGICRDLIYLFCYRNKILWVYENSRQLKQALKKTLPTVQRLIDSISRSIATSRADLKQLQQNLADALSISHAYQTNLSYLQENLNNLEINTENYRKRLKIMTQKDANADLQFLTNFYEFARAKYITQIQSDIGSLDAGNQPLNNTISTIQGIIEIEKTKNERTLNKTIAIVSAGIGTAGISATTFSKSQEIVIAWLPLAPKQPIPVSYYWYSFALAFSLSVVIGVFFAFLMFLFNCILDRRG